MHHLEFLNGAPFMRSLFFSAAILIFSTQIFAADDVVKTISTGAEVDQASVLVPGKFTVFEFYADW
jgi:hypothetical protein